MSAAIDAGNAPEEHWLERLNRELCEKLGAGNCPFCGGAPTISGGGMNLWRITCKKCGSQTGNYHTDQAASDAWNSRAPDCNNRDTHAEGLQV